MSSTQEYKWPNDFPVDAPVEGAIPANGYVYRLVDQVPPTSADFQMYRLDKPKSKVAQQNKAVSFGISLWEELDRISAQKVKYPAPEQFGNKLIVGGTLQPELGVILKTVEDNHITLWKQIEAEPHLHICEEVT